MKNIRWVHEDLGFLYFDYQIIFLIIFFDQKTITLHEISNTWIQFSPYRVFNEKIIRSHDISINYHRLLYLRPHEIRLNNLLPIPREFVATENNLPRAPYTYRNDTSYKRVQHANIFK